VILVKQLWLPATSPPLLVQLHDNEVLQHRAERFRRDVTRQTAKGSVKNVKLFLRSPLANRRLLYAASYLYSGQASSRRPYEIRAAELSQCRPMDAYCSDDGARLLREELTKGIESILLQILFAPQGFRGDIHPG
jgi:hypothetical protein